MPLEYRHNLLEKIPAAISANTNLSLLADDWNMIFKLDVIKQGFKKNVCHTNQALILLGFIEWIIFAWGRDVILKQWHIQHFSPYAFIYGQIEYSSNQWFPSHDHIFHTAFSHKTLVQTVS
jgi:hypothetical protein